MTLWKVKRRPTASARNLSTHIPQNYKITPGTGEGETEAQAIK
jgi:hypothetical protein